MNALIVLLVIVALTACGSKPPTQSLESPKTIATTQDMCPLDIVGQWQRVRQQGGEGGPPSMISSFSFAKMALGRIGMVSRACGPWTTTP